MTQITIDRALVEQALEALQAYGAHAPNCEHLMLLTSLPPQRKPCSCGLVAAITALRERLAQQEEGGGNLPPPLQAEPVAWMCSSPELMEKGYKRFSSRREGDWNIPVYTAPPQRKPLTLTDLQEALVLTNLIDRNAIDDPEEYDEGLTLAQIDELYRIIKG